MCCSTDSNHVTLRRERTSLQRSSNIRVSGCEGALKPTIEKQENIHDWLFLDSSLITDVCASKAGADVSPRSQFKSNGKVVGLLSGETRLLSSRPADPAKNLAGTCIFNLRGITALSGVTSKHL